MPTEPHCADETAQVFDNQITSCSFIQINVAQNDFLQRFQLPVVVEVCAKEEVGGERRQRIPTARSSQ